MTNTNITPQSPCDCLKPGSGPRAGWIPNVTVTTHEGSRALFYDDLILGKCVLVNFMSIHHEKIYPVTDNLVKVYDMLGDRMGRDAFMISITADPERDNARRLRDFAQDFGAGRKGWTFVTGQPQDMALLLSRFFMHPPGHSPERDCSMGVVRYGNEATGTWGSVPTKQEPKWIVERLNWVTPKPRPNKTPIRRGPNPNPSMPWLS